MFGHDAGDVVVHDDDFVDQTLPLACKHPDGGRAAADAHPPFGDAVHDGGLARLHGDGGTCINRQVHRLAVAERQQRRAGEAALGLAAARQVVDAAERQHL